jgi:hypothetical protein
LLPMNHLRSARARAVARVTTCVVAALAASSPIAAHAQARPIAPDGTVVGIDAGDLVVDIGSAKGLHDGDLVELWRPLRLKHPATGQVLVERFRIGTLRLTQVRTAMSLAIVEGDASRAPAAGDVVVLPDAAREAAREAARPIVIGAAPRPIPGAGAGAAPSTSPSTSTGASTSASTSTSTSTASNAPPAQAGKVLPLDPDGQALADMMAALTGADPQMRAYAYGTFVRARPKSRFTKVLNEEIAALRSPLDRAKKERGREYQWSTPKLDRVRAGEPQRFAVELDPLFIGAVVHVRKKGAPAYRSVPMENIGPRYWAATLPGDAMTDGGMEYFVEGVPKESAAVAVVGTADAPNAVDVDVTPGMLRSPETLAQVALQSEFASFNIKKPNDYVWQTEGTVGWRLRDEGIRAVRSGFGVLRGKGGTLRDLDELGRSPDTIGLTYGYIEAEITLTSTYSLIGRPILGLREQGITGGAQGFLRIGNDLRTNLSIGGEVLGTVGQRGIVQLDWRTISRFPIVLRTEVTNQPANSGDIGARAIAQVGYQLTPELVLAVRASYQGRTINHAGPGAGLAVSYQW